MLRTNFIGFHKISQFLNYIFSFPFSRNVSQFRKATFSHCLILHHVDSFLAVKMDLFDTNCKKTIFLKERYPFFLQLLQTYL